MKTFIAAFLLTTAICWGSAKLMVPDYQLRTVSYTVKADDTVWGIACRFMGAQDKHNDVRGLMLAIQDSNGLTANACGVLQPGTVLLIPLETAK